MPGPVARSSSDKPRERRRPTIGFILNNPMWDTYVRELWEGVMAGVEVADIDLVCFAGSHVSDGAKHLQQNITLFSQANPTSLDGLIAVNLLDQVFVDAIPALGVKPTVSIQPSKFPSVSTDNYAGMRAAIEHLLKVHGRRRIAFIRGTAGEPSGEERYRAYVEVLRDHRLQQDPALVYQGDFWSPSGERAVRAFIDERRVNFDAVVAANDWMAIGALGALETCGCAVPEQVSVIGFDDFPGASFSNPPLTTVRQPVRAMASRATQMVVAAIGGRSPAKTEVLPAELVVRRSCGCVSEMVVSAGAMTQKRESRTRWFKHQRPFADRRAEIVADATLRLGNAVAGLSAEWPVQLFEALVSDIDKGTSRTFLDAVEELAQQFIARDQLAAYAHQPVSALRAACLPWISDDHQHLAQAESIWQQARILIQEAGQRQVEASRALAATRDASLRDLVRSLAGAREVSAIVSALAERLERLGINSAYLAMYEGQTHPVEWSRLIMAYRDGKRLALPRDGVRVRTRDMIPAEFEPSSSRRRALMVIPIFLDFESNDQLGFGVFEVDRKNAQLCEALGEQLATALKSAVLLEEASKDVVARQQAEEKLARELRAFLDVVSAVAQGDLTKRGEEGEGTLGRIAASVNVMFAGFAGILGEVYDAAGSVSKASSDILAAATKITEGAQTGRDQVYETTSSVEEMAASMAEVSKNAETSAQRARQVLDHVRQSDLSVEAAHLAMTKIDAAVSETAQKMRLFEQRSREIFDIIALIETIAEQSKLLSLNAAISAAQAGKAGRAFAVVAGEIRRLADSSTSAVKDVAKCVEGIIQETRSALGAMENAMHEVKEGRTVSERARASLLEISTLIQDSAQLVAQIAAASHEQAQVTKHVAGSMQTISNITVQSAANAGQTTSSVKSLVSLAEQLNRAISRFKISGS